MGDTGSFASSVSKDVLQSMANDDKDLTGLATKIKFDQLIYDNKMKTKTDQSQKDQLVAADVKARQMRDNETAGRSALNTGDVVGLKTSGAGWNFSNVASNLSTIQNAGRTLLTANVAPYSGAKKTLLGQ